MFQISLAIGKGHLIFSSIGKHQFSQFEAFLSVTTQTQHLELCPRLVRHMSYAICCFALANYKSKHHITNRHGNGHDQKREQSNLANECTHKQHNQNTNRDANIWKHMITWNREDARRTMVGNNLSISTSTSVSNRSWEKDDSDTCTFPLKKITRYGSFPTRAIFALSKTRPEVLRN